jgi:hypothetical protein
MVVAVKDQEVALLKKSKTLLNDIAKEKVTLEKSRIEEAELSSELRRDEDDRDALQSELEITEQSNTVASFELQELQRMHEELTSSLEDMEKENNSLVEPILNGLRQQVNYEKKYWSVIVL